MLRCALVLCFCLITAQRSFADICAPEPVDANTPIANVYAKAADHFPTQSLEKNDYQGDEFKKAYTQQINTYGWSLGPNVHEQAISEAEVLTAVINDLANKLQWEIQTMRNSQMVGKIRIEEYMNKILQQLETFLALSPGPWIPIQPKLPNSPGPEIMVHSTEWQAIGPYYEDFGLQLRNEILHDKVLDAYERVTSQINMECNFIANNVNLALWESYKRAADRIFEAWNAYHLYKNNRAWI